MFLHCQWFGKDHFDKPSSSQYKITGMFKMSFLFRARMRGICEFSSLPFMPWSSLGTCLENVLDHAYSCLPGFFFWSSRQFRIPNPSMNVHRGSESDRGLWQEASGPTDGPTAPAPERETNSLAAAVLQNLTYPPGPRSDGTRVRA